MREKYALITVNNKTGLKEFVLGLESMNYNFVASKVCAKLLESWHIKVKVASEITGYPPIMGKKGIKLIHPKIFGGILADPSKKRHRADMKKYGIKPFSIVICNFYPFERTISSVNHKYEKAIENIDIGGPSMVRCAAKNYKNVAIITDPADYKKIIDELKDSGTVNLGTRKKLALKAFKRTKEYDGAIIDYLTKRFGGGVI